MTMQARRQKWLPEYRGNAGIQGCQAGCIHPNSNFRHQSKTLHVKVDDGPLIAEQPQTTMPDNLASRFCFGKYR